MAIEKILEDLKLKHDRDMMLLMNELKEIKSIITSQNLSTCTPKEACSMLGVNNDRYLTYFYKQQLLNRRKGGKGFLYFRAEVLTLAQKINAKQIVIPTTKAIYGKEQ